jgi:hypothetical protein
LAQGKENGMAGQDKGTAANELTKIMCEIEVFIGQRMREVGVYGADDLIEISKIEEFEGRMTSPAKMAEEMLGKPIPRAARIISDSVFGCEADEIEWL